MSKKAEEEKRIKQDTARNLSSIEEKVCVCAGVASHPSFLAPCASSCSLSFMLLFVAPSFDASAPCYALQLS